ncbi:hypothetical protein Spla01_04977 [Streptomyces platensis]|uniref:Tetratricopeptide repeat protein n=1 Tax=Streptomyces platensis TaxID=58346 RepID=A0ABX3Y273_STRPT|nr:hypothetical protein BG653_01286 [Streptomyces platensis]
MTEAAGAAGAAGAEPTATIATAPLRFHCVTARVAPSAPAPRSNNTPNPLATPSLRSSGGAGPPPPGDHTAEAARLERTAGLYPEDAEALLLRAAAHLELSGDRPAATTLDDRLLSTTADLDNPPL